MKYTQVFEYILPLYEIKIREYYAVLENAFIKESKKYDFKVILVFNEQPKNNKYLKHESFSTDYFQDGKYIVEMKLPFNYLSDCHLIIKSKYSEITSEAKKTIVAYSLFVYSYNLYKDENGNSITNNEYYERIKKHKGCKVEYCKRPQLEGLFDTESLRVKLAKQLDIDVNLIPKEVVEKFSEDNYYQCESKPVTWRSDINEIDKQLKNAQEELKLLQQKISELNDTRKSRLLEESMDI